LKPFSIILLLLISASGCTRKKAIDIDIPPYFRKLVVECYLVPGEKYKLALFESVSYLDEPRIPLVYDAQVNIIHKGDTTNLFNAIVERTDTSVGYNYMSNRKVPYDYDSDFYLHIKDKSGRELTSHCQILRPIEPSIQYIKNAAGLAYLETEVTPQPENKYYRIFANTNFLSFSTMKWEQRQSIESAKQGKFYSPYIFNKGDSVIVTFVTIEKSYFDFLNSINEARLSSADPFSQASKVTSNISGGEGIFTSYSYVRKKNRIN
jgi:hypothetical protein